MFWQTNHSDITRIRRCFSEAHQSGKIYYNSYPNTTLYLPPCVEISDLAPLRRSSGRHDVELSQARSVFICVSQRSIGPCHSG